MPGFRDFLASLTKMGATLFCLVVAAHHCKQETPLCTTPVCVCSVGPRLENCVLIARFAAVEVFVGWTKMIMMPVKEEGTSVACVGPHLKIACSRCGLLGKDWFDQQQDNAFRDSLPRIHSKAAPDRYVRFPDQPD